MTGAPPGRPVAGGRPGAGFSAGVVMLDTGFPRLLGDVGNPASFAFPVRYRRVARATVGAVVGADSLEPALADGILDAALALEADGVDLVATSCGFLGAMQERLAARLRVPVLASALAMLPFLRAIAGPGRIPGVLTFDAGRLKAAHFGPWGAGDVALAGIEGTALYRVVAEDRAELDAALVGAELAAVARELVARRPEISAIVLECTNLGPWRAEIAGAAGRPVFGIVDAMGWYATAAAGNAPGG